MRKFKISSLFLTLLLTANSLFAQSIESGKKFLYYERYNSAKDVFSKLVATNPNNVEAVYYLGQTYLGMEDTMAAQKLYQSSLQANPNAALLMVGVGEIELMQGKASDARNRFETAIRCGTACSYTLI